MQHYQYISGQIIIIWWNILLLTLFTMRHTYMYTCKQYCQWNGKRYRICVYMYMYTSLAAYKHPCCHHFDDRHLIFILKKLTHISNASSYVPYNSTFTLWFIKGYFHNKVAVLLVTSVILLLAIDLTLKKLLLYFASFLYLGLLHVSVEFFV